MERLLCKALEVANKYYDDKTLSHALRVMVYAAGGMSNDNFKGLSVPDKVQMEMIIAICHDLIEDTDYTFEDFKRDFDIEDADKTFNGDNIFEILFTAMELITKEKNESYKDYILSIKNVSKKNISGSIAYWVKMADIKDHLNLTETLNDKRKEKYLMALSILL